MCAHQKNLAAEKSMGNCFGKPEPPVVFTICPKDSKAHDFGPNAKDVPGMTPCAKCKMTKDQVDMICKRCQQHQHEWIQSVEAIPQPGAPVVARPVGAPPPPIPVGTPVQTIYTCKDCGLRRMGEEGNYTYGTRAPPEFPPARVACVPRELFLWLPDRACAQPISTKHTHLCTGRTIAEQMTITCTVAAICWAQT